jgi:hypothetical protein
MLSTAVGLRKNQDEATASARFMRQFAGGGESGLPPSSDPGAVRPSPDLPSTTGVRAPGTIPGYNGEPARTKIAWSPTVMGDDEAIAAGIYDQPPSGGAAPQTRIAPAAAPTGPAGSGPQQSGGLSPRAQQLIIASASPHLPAAQRDIAKTLLTAELDNSKMTPKQKDYAFAVAQGERRPFTEWDSAMRRSGASVVNVDTKGEGAFETEFGKDQAKRWNGYIAAGDAAQSKLADIGSMREISRRIGSQGAAAGLKETLGPYAEALGIDVGGLSDIQAYSSIIQRLAPQQRAPGSGSTSDVEFKGFLKSLPALTANPAAREAILDTMESIERQNVARADIATRLATKEINRGQAERELRGMGDPLESFRAWRKANPAAFGQALKAGIAAPQASPNADANPPRLPGQGQARPPGQQQGGPVRVQSPDDARRLAPGTRFLTPDGRELVR